MKKNIFYAVLSVLFLCSVSFLSAAEHHGSGVSADAALTLLKEGNARFTAEKEQHPNEKLDRVRSTAEHGQHPFATILACSDSRVPLEVIFDQGIGDIFAIKTAGNTSGRPQLGSIEYGVAHTGTRLVVVLGHTKCGAITAACTDGGHEGSIEFLVKAIAPAVKKTETKTGKSGKDIIPDCCKENVFHQIESIFRNSEIVRTAVAKGDTKVIAALYDIDTGKVEFFGEHPNTAELLTAPITRGQRRAAE
jgi:carbonic anhydrase